MGEVENKPSAIRYGLVCLPSISLLSAIMIYCNIDIMLSLYTLYNDSIMYNYGILYILQAAFLSALCSECCCQLFCAPDFARSSCRFMKCYARSYSM